MEYSPRRRDAAQPRNGERARDRRAILWVPYWLVRSDDPASALGGAYAAIRAARDPPSPARSARVSRASETAVDNRVPRVPTGPYGHSRLDGHRTIIRDSGEGSPSSEPNRYEAFRHNQEAMNGRQ